MLSCCRFCQVGFVKKLYSACYGTVQQLGDKVHRTCFLSFLLSFEYVNSFGEILLEKDVI